MSEPTPEAVEQMAKWLHALMNSEPGTVSEIHIDHAMQPHGSDDIPDLSEIGGHWDDRPIEWHGVGLHREHVVGGRRIARIPGYNWPNEPEACTAGLTDTTWILDGRVLLCNGCGLDGT